MGGLFTLENYMTEYKVVARNGEMNLISAYTYSDAFQQAAEFAEDKGGILTFDEN